MKADSRKGQERPELLRNPYGTPTEPLRNSCGAGRPQYACRTRSTRLPHARVSQVDDAPLERGGDGFRSVGHTELGEDVLQVVLHRVFGDVQDVGDLLVRQAFGQLVAAPAPRGR